MPQGASRGQSDSLGQLWNPSPWGPSSREEAPWAAHCRRGCPPEHLASSAGSRLSPGCRGQPYSPNLCYRSLFKESSDHSPRSPIPAEPKTLHGALQALQFSRGAPSWPLGAVGKHPTFGLSGLGQRLSSLLPDPAPSHTVCPVHRLTIHLQFHLVLVLGSGGRRGFGEKLRTGTGGGKRDTFASFLGTPGSVHFSATCLHKPWAAWSSRDPLPGAAWTWGSWAEKGASVEISFPTSEHQV